MLTEQRRDDSGGRSRKEGDLRAQDLSHLEATVFENGDGCSPSPAAEEVLWLAHCLPLHPPSLLVRPLFL
ncbi:MAG: hypothetical protein HLUCCO16_14805 [Phormidium sp. OSCR]|nr:MAG: hypothetical protein HLUCCO16_14805 [Phormidium sp. OSCR]